jgi:glutamine amidotransferase
MINSKVVIIDYGSGNLRSVFNALQLVKKLNQEIIISDNPKDLEDATHIILPGVGAFGDCILGLKAIPQMFEILQEQVLKKKKPFLGICVGMQLLADVGYEHGENKGLGFIKGKVVKIDDKNGVLKIPHMGWNDLIVQPNNHPVLQGIKTGDHVYFVHSYHFIADDENEVLAKVNYGDEITAIVIQKNIIATQFHPEKSAETGLLLLKNFLSFRQSQVSI